MTIINISYYNNRYNHTKAIYTYICKIHNRLHREYIIVILVVVVIIVMRVILQEAQRHLAL